MLVTEVGGATTARRTFRASERCPAYLSRLDGRYAVYGLGIHQPSTTYEGWQAVDFDSHGDLHVIAARFQGSQQQGFYLTSVGARCGLATFQFAPETAAVMAIGADDRMHVAYTEGTTIHNATRPARRRERAVCDHDCREQHAERAQARPGRGRRRLGGHRHAGRERRLATGPAAAHARRGHPHLRRVAGL